MSFADESRAELDAHLSTDGVCGAVVWVNVKFMGRNGFEDDEVVPLFVCVLNVVYDVFENCVCLVCGCVVVSVMFCVVGGCVDDNEGVREIAFLNENSSFSVFCSSSLSPSAFRVV